MASKVATSEGPGTDHRSYPDRGWQDQGDDIDAPVRVFLIEASPAMRVGLRRILESTGGFHVIGEAATASTGLAGVLALAPTITLVSQEVILQHGQLMRELRSRRSTTTCLVVADDDSAECFFRAIEAGAGGCIRRDAEPFEIASACRHAANGYSLVRSRLVRQMHEGGERPGAPFDMLTQQERRVLGLIAKGLSNRDIATELSLSAKTVRNYVSRMLTKLEVHNRTQAAAYYLQRQPWEQRPLEYVGVDASP